MTEQINVLKRYEPFILGKCQCGCGTDLPDLISKKKSSNKHGFLRKYLNSAHSLKGKNQSGENNPMWKGGQPKQDKDGYWLIYKPEHPSRNNENRVFLHRLIYEDYLSIIFDEPMYLPEGSEIHHINEDKEDNSLINLKYMDTRKDHKQEHLMDFEGRKCKTCGIDKSSIRTDRDGNREQWAGNERDGYQCVSCSKKDYWMKNKERITEYREKNKERILQKQRERYWKQKGNVTTKK